MPSDRDAARSNRMCDWCDDATATKRADMNGPTGTRWFCRSCYKELFAI